MSLRKQARNQLTLLSFMLQTKDDGLLQEHWSWRKSKRRGDRKGRASERERGKESRAQARARERKKKKT